MNLRGRDDEVIDRFQKIYMTSQGLHASEWTERLGRETQDGLIWWMGEPLLKNPMDLWMYQELFYQIRPDWVVETGTEFGGSAYYFASILELLGDGGKVISVDISHEKLRANPKSCKQIHFKRGDSKAPSVFSYVKRKVSGTVFVVLDSCHEADHVLEEMRLYSQLVSVDSYMVVEDTNFDRGPHIKPRFGPGPGSAVEKFLDENKDFEVDSSCERLLMTYHPGGWLKRVR